MLTDNGSQFVTPLSLQALSESKVYTDLFSLTDESEMGHIQLSRAADLLVVAPATANILAKMAAGLADDLASTVLLATDKPVLVAPAMNVRMWLHPATQANMAALDPARRASGPAERGRRWPATNSVPAASPNRRTSSRRSRPCWHRSRGPLTGRHALVTSGPTHEPIDPVRYIANRSSGRQGHAIAAALAELGARVTLVSGPVSVPDPPGRDGASCRKRAAKCWTPANPRYRPTSPSFAAAVADWRVEHASSGKIKKQPDAAPPVLTLVPNPDILATIAAAGPDRPRLVVGFAAETDDLMANAQAKLKRKNADWIVANDVSPETGIMGGAENAVQLVSASGIETWPRLAKDDVARRLARRIAEVFD